MTLKTTAPAPKMKSKKHEFTHLSQKFSDPYFWFREKENPEVIAHLNAENEYTQAVLKPLSKTKDLIWEELKCRLKEEDQSYPVSYDDYEYYSKDLAGFEHKVYCRKQKSVKLSAEQSPAEEVILDMNELAKEFPYLKLGVFEVSPDHKTLAYSLDTDGSERFTIYFKNLETHRLYKHQLPNTYYSFAWSENSETVYFMELNEKLRPDEVYCYELGANPNTKLLVYQEPSEEFFVRLHKSRSKNFIFIEAHGSVTSEWHHLPATGSHKKSQIIVPREHLIEYTVEDDGRGNFLIHTNKGAQNFRVVSAPVSDPSEKNWTEVIAHRPKVYLEAIDVFKDRMFIFVKEAGLEKLEMKMHAASELYTLELPEANCQLSAFSNIDFSTKDYKFNFCSLVTPSSVLSFDFATQKIKELKVKEIPTYNRKKYTTERVFLKSHDEVEIPVSLLYKKDLKRDGRSPCYLYGYGSYGMSMPPVFRSAIISLVDRGFIFALAHIRGGSEMGRHWYEDGKLLKKKNTFLDFVSVAEGLIAQKFTQAGEIAICGGSAGGMLMGAVANLRPDLFKVVAAHVPFVDVVNTMLDSSLRLTTIEYDEWGNPNKEDYFKYILSYSPYDNVKAQAYPHMFVTAGLNDPRVTYWEPAKWVQKLRDMKTDKNLIVFKTNMEAGHSGKSGRFEALKEYAEEYSFILAAFGMI